MSASNQPVRIRPGTSEDTYPTFKVFLSAIRDLNRRTGVPEVEGDDPVRDQGVWEALRGCLEHLTETAEHFYVAEHAGEVIAYARSIRRGSMLELTDLFVLPGRQSSGVGKALLSRAFPREPRLHRLIIASTDAPAQALYLRSGVYPRFPVAQFNRAPQALPLETGLVIQETEISSQALEAAGAIDTALFGNRRDLDHSWLASDRRLFLYHRGNLLVGYGYVGRHSGPFALLDPADFPAVLAHAETQLARQGIEEAGFIVPLINTHAVDALLARGYRMEPFLVQIMTEAPWGKFENYLLTRPMFFL